MTRCYTTSWDLTRHPAGELAEEMARLWRVHDLMQSELHERRARAGTMFAVGSGILLGLIAAGLTASLQDAMAAIPPVAIA